MQLTDSVDLNISLLCCDCFFCHTLILFSSFFLVSDCLLASLACAGIVLCALSTHWKTVTVTDATIATDIHQTLDVQLNLTAEITFYFVACSDSLTHGCCLSVGPLLHLDILVNASCCQNLVG